MPFVKQLQEQEKKKKEEEKLKKGGEKGSKSVKSGKSEESSKISGVTPDATLSLATPGSTMATPDATQSSDSAKIDKKTRRSRDDVAQTIPTAAALMENVFDDEDSDGDGDDLISYTTYQKQMQDYLDSAPKGENGDEYSITDRSIVMETMSSNSREWVKSFQSLGSQGSGMMMSVGTSLRGVEDGADMPPPEGTSRPGISAARSQRPKMQNSISMLSDLTDLSGRDKKSTRSAKMNNSKDPSNFSMLSELTDLSEGLKDMGLKPGSN